MADPKIDIRDGFCGLSLIAEAFDVSTRHFQQSIRPHAPADAIKFYGRRPYFKFLPIAEAYFNFRNPPKSCPTCGRAMSSAKSGKKTKALTPR